MINKKLNRSTSHRNAMLRNMVTDLLIKRKIVTTVIKAKTLRPIVEKFITLGKNNNLESKKKAFSYLRTKEAIKSLFDEISPKYFDKPGGYTRIIKLANRRGDNAAMAIIELI